MPLSEIGLKGSHNVENVLAAVCVGVLAGVRPSTFAERSRNSRPSSIAWNTSPQ